MGGREEGGGGGTFNGGGGGNLEEFCMGEGGGLFALEGGGGGLFALEGGGGGLFALEGGGGGADLFEFGGGGGGNDPPCLFPNPGEGGGGSGRPTILGGLELGGGGLFELEAPCDAPPGGAEGGPLLGGGGGCDLGTLGAAPEVLPKCEFELILSLLLLKLAIELDTDLCTSDMSVSLWACFGLFVVGGGGGGPPLDGPFTILLFTLLLFDCTGLFDPGGRNGPAPGAEKEIKLMWIIYKYNSDVKKFC